MVLSVVSTSVVLTHPPQRHRSPAILQAAHTPFSPPSGAGCHWTAGHPDTAHRDSPGAGQSRAAPLQGLRVTVVVHAYRLPPGATPRPPLLAIPLFPWAGLVNRQRPSAKVRAIEAGNRGPGLRGVWHLDEAKAAGVSGVSIRKQTHTRNVPIGLKHLAHLVFGGAKRKISNKNMHGSFLLCALHTQQTTADSAGKAQHEGRRQRVRARTPRRSGRWESTGPPVGRGLALR